jgi:outer membrane protein OmpA-like peptidoglycan-associated protein
MKRLMGLGPLAAVLAAAGCHTSVGNEYVYQDVVGQRAANREMVVGAQNEQEANGVVRQKSVFPHHFVADSPELNELGQHDLKILAAHYKDHVLPYTGSTKVLQEVKVYFDYNKSFIRSDAHAGLDGGAALLSQNPAADIIITGRADQRGSQEYNDKLGAKRADEVRAYLISTGVDPARIKIVSRGKLDAAAPTGDEQGMQKDRHAVFQVAELQDYPVNLNVKQGDASDELYDARKKSVRTFLTAQGVDPARIALTDGLPGGDGMPSQQAVVFLIDSFDSSEQKQGAQQGGQQKAASAPVTRNVE